VGSCAASLNPIIVRPVKLTVWLALSVIWGLTWLAVRIGLNDLPPVTFAGIRFLVAALILWPVVLARKTKLPREIGVWKIIGGTALLTIAIPYTLQFWGQQYVPSGLAAVMFATVPLFTIVFAHIGLPNEPFTLQKLGGVLLGLVGVALIFSDQLRTEDPLAVWGCLGFLTGAVTHALAQVTIKARGQEIDPMAIAAGQTAIGGVLMFLLGVSMEGNPLEITWTTQALLSLAYLSIFGSALAFFLLYWLLQHVRVTTVTSMGLVHPVVAVSAGWIVLNEDLGWTVMIGAAAVLGGLALIVVRPPSRPTIQEQE
jgi:drug/metabolite transporter (DMT)-like permease